MVPRISTVVSNLGRAPSGGSTRWPVILPRNSPTFSPNIVSASLHNVSRFCLFSLFVSQLGHHLPSAFESRTLRFRRGEQPQRRRSGGCSPSLASGGSAVGTRRLRVGRSLSGPPACPCA